MPEKYATLGKIEVPGTIENIITSSKSDNSDRIYMYTSNEALGLEINSEEKE